MILKELHNFELHRLNKKKKKKENILAVWWISGLVLLQCFFMALGVLFVMKTLEDEWYIVIKAYVKLLFLRFWEIFCIIIAILHVRSIPTYRVYQLYDKNDIVRDFREVMNLFSDPEALNELWEEGLTMLKVLAHPHVMRLIGICKDGPTPGIIMPFMENGSLLSYVQKKKDLVVPTDTRMEETKVDG